MKDSCDPPEGVDPLDDAIDNMDERLLLMDIKLTDLCEKAVGAVKRAVLAAIQEDREVSGFGFHTIDSEGEPHRFCSVMFAVGDEAVRHMAQAATEYNTAKVIEQLDLDLDEDEDDE